MRILRLYSILKAQYANLGCAANRYTHFSSFLSPNLIKCFSLFANASVTLSLVSTKNVKIDSHSLQTLPENGMLTGVNTFELSDYQKRENVINNPHLLDWLFTERTEAFVKYWLKNTLGATWHWFRYEYAVQRGTIHCHGVAKLKVTQIFVPFLKKH